MENDSAKPDVDVIMRLEACRSVSVKCIWEIPIKENCLMSNTKTMIAVLVALFGALMLGLMAGCMNKADKEPLSAKVTVLAEDKPSTVYSGTVTDLDGNAIKGAKLHILRI